MSSEKITLPTIDFSSKELKPETLIWELVKAEVRKALEEFGCFQALYDKIPEETRTQVFDSLAEYFYRPSEGVAGNISDKVYEGYIGGIPNRTLKESLSIDAGKFDKARVKTSTSLGDTTFHILESTSLGAKSETVLDYIESIMELEKTIRTMILESFGLEKCKDEHVISADYSYRFMKYKPLNIKETELGLSSHADKNVLSILDQQGANGLEVLTKDDQWIEVDFRPNSFCVLVGEMFHAWTNGRLHAPYHRVMMNSGKITRYTIGVFSNYKSNFIVKAPEELVDEEHPQQFKPFEVSGYQAFFNQFGYQSKIKDYCGV